MPDKYSDIALDQQSIRPDQLDALLHTLLMHEIQNNIVVPHPNNPEYYQQPGYGEPDVRILGPSPLGTAVPQAYAGFRQAPIDDRSMGLRGYSEQGAVGGAIPFDLFYDILKDAPDAGEWYKLPTSVRDILQTDMPAASKMARQAGAGDLDKAISYALEQSEQKRAEEAMDEDAPEPER